MVTQGWFVPLTYDLNQVIKVNKLVNKYIYNIDTFTEIIVLQATEEYSYIYWLWCFSSRFSSRV